MLGVGESGAHDKDEFASPPRSLRQHRAAQRQASNQASDEQGALGEAMAREVPEYFVQCKKRARKGRVASDGGRWAARA